jgi:tRNA-dihydrouridine synthase 3
VTAEELFRGRLIMAPMTRGTDGPFRCLLAESGCSVALGEMAYAHRVVRGERSEMALLRRHPAEGRFGVQLAGKDPQVMAEAARIAEGQGADFVDVNLGCPIDDATRRGFGAALLTRATRVASIVAAMKAAVRVPVTIKLRLGWSDGKPTFLKIAHAAQEAGADAVALHARSRAQRYRRPADWGAVAELSRRLSVPVIGNGAVFTWREARERLAGSGCAAVMVGRWALAKPWIFGEYAAGRDAEPDAEGRLALVRRYVELCREHFGDDEHGRIRTRRFLTFHHDFFRRFRRQAPGAAVNAEDPREWGRPPEGELECWLARADRTAVEALADWLVDGGPPRPPGPPEEDAPRAARLVAHG